MHIKTGDHESHKRNMDIRKTQQCIKHVLTERWYAWENAWKVAHEDPEVDLTAEPGTSAYKPVLHEVPTSRSDQTKIILLIRNLRNKLRGKRPLMQPWGQVEVGRLQPLAGRKDHEVSRTPRISGHLHMGYRRGYTEEGYCNLHYNTQYIMDS